ncbi:hypothetical protein ADMFC3_10250 [Geovibrio sp. ADMFC3]
MKKLNITKHLFWLLLLASSALFTACDSDSSSSDTPAEPQAEIIVDMPEHLYHEDTVTAKIKLRIGTEPIRGETVTVTENGGTNLTITPSVFTTDYKGEAEFTITTASGLPEPESSLGVSLTLASDTAEQEASLFIEPVPAEFNGKSAVSYIFMDMRDAEADPYDNTVLIDLPEGENITMGLEEIYLMNGYVTAEIFGNKIRLTLDEDMEITGGRHTVLLPLYTGDEYTPLKYTLVVSDGSEGYPYPIENLDHLLALAPYTDIDSARHFELLSDLDLSGIENWTPINFKGILDGKGHSVTGMTITVDPTLTGSVNAGFFGTLDGGVKNLHVEGSITSSSEAVTTNAGLLAADGIQSVIERCSTSGTVSIAYGAAAGIVSLGNASIDQSYSTATIENIGENGLLGGIAVYAASVKNSYFAGSITNSSTAAANYAGGIVAGSGSGVYTVENCYSTAESIISKMKSAGVACGNNGANTPAVKNSIALTRTLVGRSAYVIRVTTGRDRDATIDYNVNQTNNYALSGMELLLYDANAADLKGSIYTPLAKNNTGRDSLFGEDITPAELTPEFFTDPVDAGGVIKSVGWDTDIWDVDFASRDYKLPILKGLDLERQRNIAMPAHLITP